MRGANFFEQLETRQLLAANLVADFGGIYPTNSVAVNGVSYFVANDGPHGSELWKSDGTQVGTNMLRDITPGSGSSNILQITPFKNGVAFFVFDGRNTTLWTSDGTTDGTVAVKTVPSNAILKTVTVLDGKLLFVCGDASDADNPLTGGQLWSSDGTPDGTSSIFDLPNYDYVEGTGRDGMFVVGDRVVFETLYSMWSTDGTTAGTVQLTNGYGQQEDFIDGARQITSGGNVMFFIPGYLWTTDGTVQGTTQIARLGASSSLGSIIANGVLYFQVERFDQVDIRDLWSTDGTVAGTIFRAQIPDALFSDAGSSIGVGSRMVFMQRFNPLQHPDEQVDGTPYSLYAFDPSTNSMDLLKTFDPSLVINPSLISFGDEAYFTVCPEGANGPLQLWRTDGTVDGTYFVKLFGDNLQLANVNGKLAATASGETTLIDPDAGDAAEEPLEGRTSLSGGVLHIFGTRGDDSIRLYDVNGNPNRFIVNINGSKRSYAFSDVSKIVIYGYSGDDNIAVYQKPGAFTARCLVWGGNGNDIIYTGNARDTIYGEDGEDSIFGGNNDDDLSGGMGNDSIQGGNGDDMIRGDEGADNLQGDAGIDVLSGGDDGSHDTLDGGHGVDVIFGQAVYDIFYGATGDPGTPVDEVLQV